MKVAVASRSGKEKVQWTPVNETLPQETVAVKLGSLRAADIAAESSMSTTPLLVKYRTSAYPMSMTPSTQAKNPPPSASKKYFDRRDI